MRTTLKSIRPGRSARIVAHDSDGAVHQRLLAMGLTRGTVVDVLRVAPFGDPMQVRVRGFHLALRCSEAENITVQEC